MRRLLALIASLSLACGPLAPPPTPEEAMRGKWVAAEGQSHCLALDEAGRFELSRLGSSHRAKLVVTGAYRLDLPEQALFVTPERIHTGKFVSRCKKRVDSAADHDRFEILEGELAVGVESKLTVTRNEDELRVCLVGCADMVREP